MKVLTDPQQHLDSSIQAVIVPLLDHVTQPCIVQGYPCPRLVSVIALPKL